MIIYVHWQILMSQHYCQRTFAMIMCEAHVSVAHIAEILRWVNIQLKHSAHQLKYFRGQNGYISLYSLQSLQNQFANGCRGEIGLTSELSESIGSGCIFQGDEHHLSTY